MSPDDGAATSAASAEGKREARQRLKAERLAAAQAEREARLARYRTLRANVRRRRAAYVLLLLLAIAVLAATVWDMVFNAADLKWLLLPGYPVPVVLGVLALVSRRRHLEEVNELAELRRVFLEDPGSGDIFELTSSRLEALQGAELSSPTTGEFFRVPPLDTPPLERAFPTEPPVSRRFDHDGIDVEVATYGRTPRDVTIRRPAARVPSATSAPPS